MKKLLILLVTVAVFAACNTKPTPQVTVEKEKQPMPTLSTQKALVAYFSATGNTKKVAENLAKALHADIYEIKPAVPYTAADLNWRDKTSRSSVEMSNESSRPEMAENDISVKEYDVIYLGFPIWWGTAPRIVKTFLEKHDFSNKKIVLFATSGSSGMGNTDKDLKPSVSASTKIVKGKTLNSNPSVEELKKWVATFL